MPTHKLKYEYYLGILLWLGLAAFSWYLASLRLQAMDFHTRDYSYYTEFIIKLTDSVKYQYYSINPGGYNFLSRLESDGCDGFYQWIHLEPIRFLQGGVYYVTRSVSTVLFFNALLVCSPILALPKMIKGKWSLFFIFLWTLLFALFPATLLATGYDNRPCMFLGVGFFWIIYSYLYSENKVLQLASYLFLFTIREEALILNATVCLFLLFRLLYKKTSLTFFLIHLLCLLGYAIGLYIYYSYWGYHLFSSSHQQLGSPALIVGAVIGIGWLIYMLIKKRMEHLLFLPIIIFIVQLVSLYQHSMFPDSSYAWYDDPRLIMIWPIIFGFILYIRKTKLSLYLLGGTIFLFIGLSLNGKYGLPARIKNWQVSIKKNEKLFQLNQEIDPNVKVLTDYKTHQAFVGRRELFCIDRLPCYFERQGDRFYPGNSEKLLELIEDGTYIVVTHQTAINILPLVNSKGFTWELNSLMDYQIIQLNN